MQYGNRISGTHERVYSQFLRHGNSNNEIRLRNRGRRQAEKSEYGKKLLPSKLNPTPIIHPLPPGISCHISYQQCEQYAFMWSLSNRIFFNSCVTNIKEYFPYTLVIEVVIGFDAQKWILHHSHFYTLSGRIGKVVASHAAVARRFPLRSHWFIVCTRGSVGTTHEGGGCDQSIGSTVSDVIVCSWLW